MAWCALAAMALAAGAGCEPDYVLIVQAAGSQPDPSVAIGTIVIAQTKGGDTLGIRARGCSLLSDAAGSSASSSCISVRRALNQTYFTVVDSPGACVVHAELYRSFPSPDGGRVGFSSNPPDGARSDTVASVCPGAGAKVMELEVPIVRAEPPTADGGISNDGGGDGSASDAPTDGPSDAADGPSDAASNSDGGGGQS